jgi:hypothetical protein
MPGQVVRTLSLQIEGIPAGLARSGARSDLAADIAEIESDRKKGRLSDEDARVRLRTVRARLVDLDPGSGHQGAGWAMHLTISARTRQDLAEASQRVEEAADDAGITGLDWLDAHQSAALGFTWPIAGLAPMPHHDAFLGDQLAAPAKGPDVTPQREPPRRPSTVGPTRSKPSSNGGPAPCRPARPQSSPSRPGVAVVAGAGVRR